MEPNGILAILLCLSLLIAIKVGFVGMSILIQHAKPEFIERASEHYRKKPRWRVIFVGLVNGVAIPLVSVLLISTQVLTLFGLLLLVAYLWLALLGYTVVYRDIGSRLFGDLEGNRELKITLYGGILAEAAFLAPVLGQLYSIALFIRSLGAVTLAILGRKRDNQ